MDKKQAQALIKETFGTAFDKGRFTNFIINLLNLKAEQIEHKHPYSGNFIPDSYEQYISTLERIAKYTDGEHKIDVLIAKLKKETSIERARTMQRNFVAWYLNGSRGGELKDAALVAFVAPNEEDWRFSLVKMDYRFEEGKKGRMRVKEEFTPARRWSFLVGANENSHTAQSQLVDRVADDENKPTLTQLEEVFNIEKVTKEFFEKYKELFLWTKETLDNVVKKDKKIKADFETKGVNTVDFSKKLLGQIVFLYFLQKKGWFGVKRDAGWGTGPKNFLRELFEGKHGTYKNFFNDILEPLFYEALARERDDDFYSRFNCKIPFLNGGLFDPINNYDWVHTDILLPNDLFSNDYKTKEGDKGNGVLDIFDRYNFTVKEDEPLEKEVAVDPEMLGKVFENLLEVKDRKSKGTYYTPREVVHYMCQQSVINYLATEFSSLVIASPAVGGAKQSLPTKDDIETLIKYGEHLGENETTVEAKGKETSTYFYKIPESIRDNAKLIDEKLSTIKVCDPAIGSGAFLVGMMTEIVKIRNVLTSYISHSRESGNLKFRTSYNFKRDCIQSSLYGVDIDPSAVEIAKLRLWLSLIVDENDIKQIKPLPNLDYKIMQGNSLLEEYEGIRLFDEKLTSTVNLDKEKQIADLKKKQSEISSRYIKLHQANKLNRIQKEQIDDELKKINSQIKRLEQSSKTVEENVSLFDIYNTAKKKSDELKQLHKEFFESTQKSKKDELKKQIEKLEWDLIEVTLKEQGKNSEIKRLAEFKKINIRPFFLWKLHFSEVFQSGGFDVVIANPPYVKEYVNRDAFEGLRESPYYQGKMDIWYLFACEGLDLLKRDSGILTFIAQNNWVTSYGASKMRNKVVTGAQILSLIDFGDFKIFEAGIQTMVMIFRKNTGQDSYSFDYRKIYGNDLVLKDVISVLNKEDNAKAEYLTPSITRGNFLDRMLTFSNSNIEPILEKLSSKANFRLSDKEVANGIHHHHDCVNKKRKEILGGQYKVRDGIFVLSNEEKERIPFTKKELGLIKPSYTTKQLFRWYGNSANQEWVIYTDSSFKDKKQIENYPNIKKHLDQFRKVITSDNKPYGLHRARDEYLFKGEKIIAVRKCARPTFTYVNFDSYVSATFYVIKSERINLKYLTAVLNSKLIAFWLKHKGKMQGNNYQIDKEPILDIPIKEGSVIEYKSLAEIVDKILSITKSADYLTNSSKQAKVKEYECQIDQMVYELYGLTKKEIEIIEGAGK